MRDFFAGLNDHPIMKFLSKLVDLAGLNIMFAISCIPIVTIGAALTALQYVCITGWDTQNSHIIKMYFGSFKRNFKQATILWLILLLVGVGVGFLGYTTFMQWNATESNLLRIFLVVSVVMILVYALVFTYAWPLLAKFDNTVGRTLYNAFIMAVSHLPGTVVCWAMVVVAAYAVYAFAAVKVFAVLFLFSLLAYLQASIFRSAFLPYLEEAAKEEEEKWKNYDPEQERAEEDLENGESEDMSIQECPYPPHD